MVFFFLQQDASQNAQSFCPTACVPIIMFLFENTVWKHNHAYFIHAKKIDMVFWLWHPFPKLWAYDSKPYQNSFCLNHKSNDPIRSQFCTCHNSGAVVTCATFVMSSDHHLLNLDYELITCWWNESLLYSTPSYSYLCILGSDVFIWQKFSCGNISQYFKIEIMAHSERNYHSITPVTPFIFSFLSEYSAWLHDTYSIISDGILGPTRLC